MTSLLEEYRRLTYDKTIQKLKQEQESRKIETPLGKLLAAKTDIQPPKK